MASSAEPKDARSTSGTLDYNTSNAVQREVQVEPGQYRCINKNGEVWPVVICDEDFVRRFFRSKDIRPRGEHVAFYPAVYPGTLTLLVTIALHT